MNTKKAKRLRKAMVGVELPEVTVAMADVNTTLGADLRVKHPHHQRPVLANHKRRIRRLVVRNGLPVNDAIQHYTAALQAQMKPKKSNKKQKGANRKLANAK